ncbi:uncharacterized protein LOC143932998 [Lithobates pipiens]
MREPEWSPPWKAFDTGEWPFLWEVLRRMGFPLIFINWLQVLYLDPTSLSHAFSCQFPHSFPQLTQLALEDLLRLDFAKKPTSQLYSHLKMTSLPSLEKLRSKWSHNIPDFYNDDWDDIWNFPFTSLVSLRDRLIQFKMLNNPFPKSGDTRKKWSVGISVVIILALIIVAGALIGVHMTQKHTEQIVTVAFANAEGEKIVQTISVNKRDEVAVIYVRSHKYPGTFLFDYQKKLIAFRKPNSTECFVLRMEEDKTPALSALLKGVEYFRTHDANANDRVIYNFKEVEEANPADVGSSIYLMCSDADIYWAKNVNFKQRGFDVSIEGGLKIGGVFIGGGIKFDFGR